MQARTLLAGFVFLVFVVTLYVLENSANLNQQKVGIVIFRETDFFLIYSYVSYYPEALDIHG